jgi:hypothetical protein
MAELEAVVASIAIRGVLIGEVLGGGKGGSHALISYADSFALIASGSVGAGLP